MSEKISLDSSDRTNLIKLQFHPEEIFHFIYR